MHEKNSHVQGNDAVGEDRASGEVITEATLLSMPTSAYMDDIQLAFFKKKLVDMKEQILSNANQTSENLKETSMVPDPADRATIEEEYAIELRTRDRESKLLRKIDEALCRIEDKSYGWCDETGEPVGLARLLARPTTSLSVEAQQRRELRQKLYNC